MVSSATSKSVNTHYITPKKLKYKYIQTWKRSLWTKSDSYGSDAARLLDWFNNSLGLRSGLTGKENRNYIIFLNFNNPLDCIMFWLWHHTPTFYWLSCGHKLVENGTLKWYISKCSCKWGIFSGRCTVVRQVHNLCSLLFSWSRWR